MNKPVAWRYKYDQEDTDWNFRDDEKLIKSMTRVHHIIAEPLYTQEELEEARKLGMQQERALWNLSESTQEFESFDRTASHTAGEYVAHPVKEQKCIVKDCENHKHEGGFVGDLCKPCHQFITTGEGVYSQAYRNTHQAELTDEEWIATYQTWLLTSNDPLVLKQAILRKAQEK